jgi:hypothetical protein
VISIILGHLMILNQGSILWNLILPKTLSRQCFTLEFWTNF